MPLGAFLFISLLGTSRFDTGYALLNDQSKPKPTTTRSLSTLRYGLWPTQCPIRIEVASASLRLDTACGLLGVRTIIHLSLRSPSSAKRVSRCGSSFLLPYFFRKLGQIRIFAFNQSLFLFPAPMLLLLFSVKSIIYSRILFKIDQLYWHSLFRITCTISTLMLMEMDFQIDGTAGLTAPIRAF